jgi:hypothetical protein
LGIEIKAGGNVEGNDPDFIARPDVVQRRGLRAAAGQ